MTTSNDYNWVDNYYSLIQLSYNDKKIVYYIFKICNKINHSTKQLIIDDDKLYF